MQVTTSALDSALPPYAGMLAAYQRAHAAELQKMIADLPLRRGDCVLDLACGEGTYTHWLAERVGPQGHVVGLDIDPAFLEAAEATLHRRRRHGQVSLQRADGAHLPFADHSFDLIWCAQSMDTLPDPEQTLREMRRVTRPGGHVAIFENDVLHQAILPWPPDLELAVRQAQLRSFAAEERSVRQFTLARRFCAAMDEAGFRRCRIAVYPSIRRAPLSSDEQTVLHYYLQDIGQRADDFLDASMRRRLRALIDPQSAAYMLNDPHFVVTYIDYVACGVT